ncbi:MAG: glycosyltransferase [Salinivirgaceae bacterium]|jgi:hypothetical protein|nr:hypothetical protein [Bacteroidales bacterium]
MTFANNYLIGQNPRYISTPPDNSLSGVVVIPCCSEPDVLENVKLLCQCDPPEGFIEIIIVVNFPEGKPKETHDYNKEIFDRLVEFSKQLKNDKIKVLPIWLGAVRKKFAGAGYARKVGMDEAIRRFNDINRPENFIISLDADTTVMQNYLSELEKLFYNNNSVRQAVVPFVHPKKDIDKSLCHAIMLYELYLRYYRLAMEYIGWQWAYHTVGSAFAVKASVYVEQQGMNRKNAGEDFYFLNKLFPLGGTVIANNTMVFPSARFSDRVPFGTGPALKQIIENRFSYKTYCLQSILDLRYFLENIQTLFGADSLYIDSYIDNAPKALSDYWKETNFIDKINECNSKCAHLNSFNKRLLRKFDAFQIVKYLNFAHENHYKKSEVCKEFELLVNELKANSPKHAKIIEIYSNTQKRTNVPEFNDTQSISKCRSLLDLAELLDNIPYPTHKKIGCQ